MTEDAAKVLEQALELGENDRAQVASELLASLQPCDDEVDKAWAAEITRRVAEARRDEAEGRTRGEDWRTTLARIEAEVLRR